MLHKRSDERKNFTHEPDRVQYVNGLEPNWHGILKILEEPANATYRRPDQVTKSHVMHIEEENVSRRATFRIEVRVDGHEQQLDTIVEHVSGRL